MKKLNKNQWIAVWVGLAAIAFLLFGSSFLNLFFMNNNNQDEGAQSLGVPESGFVFEDTTVGEGETVEIGDEVTVHYVGTLTTGRVFDSSRDRNMPFTFTIGRGDVIRGWDEGLLGMKVGSVRQLIIAPDYAYGPQAVGGLPANSVLIFEVELLDVKKGQ